MTEDSEDPVSTPTDPTLSIYCPTCYAKPGAPCVSVSYSPIQGGRTYPLVAGGEELGSFHVFRRLAVEAL